MEAALVYLAGIAFAWTVLYGVLRWRRGNALKNYRNLTLYPLFFMVKSTRLVSYIDRISSRSRLLWRVLSNIGLTTSIGLSLFSVYFLVENLRTYLFRPEAVGVGNIIIPLIIGVTIRLEHLPYLLAAFAIVLITHEGMHGIVARLEGMRLRSTGVFLAFIFPGGFVEPDEEDFKRSPTISKMRVAAAGSFANFLVGIVTLALMLGLFTPTIMGVIVLETSGGVEGPSPGEVIYSVNGVPVNHETLYRNITLTGSLTVETSRMNYTYRAKEGLTVPLAWILRSIGVTRIDYYRPMIFEAGSPDFEYSVYRALWWIQLVSFGVAIFNMLPVRFLDGHLLYMSLIQSRVRDERKLRLLDTALTVACLTLLATNIFFTYKTFGFFQL